MTRLSHEACAFCTGPPVLRDKTRHLSDESCILRNPFFYLLTRILSLLSYRAACFLGRVLQFLQVCEQKLFQGLH